MRHGVPALVSLFVGVIGSVDTIRAQQCDPSLIFKKDAVELIRGKEIDGLESIFADHFRYRYQFASEENKAEFLKNPAKYEIQLGGACGRMGALSGPGSVGIYAVHNGKLYIFASEGCRKTFLSRAKDLLEVPDAPPTATEESTKKGRELLEKAVLAMGGVDRLDAAKNYRQVIEGEDKDGNETVKTSETLTIEFPDRIRRDHRWGEYSYSYIVSGDKGWYQGTKDGYPLHAQQCAVFRRQTVNRNLVGILKARNAPGTVVSHVGSGELEEGGKKTTVEKVAVHFDGATTTLAIEPTTGRIVSIRYQAQGAKLFIIPEEAVLSEYSVAGGLKLPLKTTRKYEDPAVIAPPLVLNSIRVNEQIDPATFLPPGK